MKTDWSDKDTSQRMLTSTRTYLGKAKSRFSSRASRENVALVDTLILDYWPPKL